MDLEETRAFLAVLDHGSFKAAAETVRQPRATLRRRVEALEARAGVCLLERSRSGVAPTPAGELLAGQARVMLRETRALFHALREVGDEPSGDVRVGVPVGLPPHTLALVFGLLHDQFPRIRLHLRVSDDPVTELIEHVEIALHFDHDEPPGRWRSHTLMGASEGLKASPSYLQRNGMPRSIAALSDHEILGWRGEGNERWPLRGGGSFAIEPALTTTDRDVLRRFATLGLGIALLPDGPSKIVDDDDELIPVLDDVVGRTRKLRLVVPEFLAETAKISAIVEHLQRCMSAVEDRATLPPRTLEHGPPRLVI